MIWRLNQVPKWIPIDISSGFTSVITSYYTTKDTYQVQIINLSIGPSETTTKYPSHGKRNCQLPSQETCQLKI